MENWRTSPCYPRAPNLLHVLPSRMVGWNDLCTPAAITKRNFITNAANPEPGSALIIAHHYFYNIINASSWTLTLSLAESSIISLITLSHHCFSWTQERPNYPGPNFQSLHDYSFVLILFCLKPNITLSHLLLSFQDLGTAWLSHAIIPQRYCNQVAEIDTTDNFITIMVTIINSNSLMA